MNITNHLKIQTRPEDKQWAKVYGLFYQNEGRSLFRKSLDVGQKDESDIHFCVHFTARDGRIEAVLTPELRAKVGEGKQKEFRLLEQYRHLRSSRWMPSGRTTASAV